ncbi:hypothetical protein [Gimesia maris]|jgi:endonuclease-3|uniref:Endonuclease III n=1 Tax=Gimesia maris TaxID=122 RepID=A0A3D3R9N0_9PLAN|nr:hypothetical protein [Gimesia maris]MAC53100.1 hypothetical protein [Gimesia sp.]EDL56707.1 hypothetical protein PM8797T_17749 [Gimesia maris DSM 8797]QDT77809.1 hypothetical protein Mal35_12370 [Gimesia maris]QDU13471.1 hypothetical protein CA11_12540 [Gimesia maris]QEG15399.1 hypothetical protein GmarT_12390 [Gimesia maris]|tara:strand:- start:88906 stop:89835 length:930 start_codon:yes stop_codon:yes gene_type:complete
MVTKKISTSDKQAVCKKLIASLKKRYSATLPKYDRPVLETILHAICLENTTNEKADVVFDALLDGFHDLNEIRVSTISELELVFADVGDAEWRAYRIRTVLQYVFDKEFCFDLEMMRKKTLEQAQKQLARMKTLTPFVLNHTLQVVLGSHLVPADEKILNASKWLGLLPEEESIETASDTLKSTVRKTDAPLFSHLLRCLATDEELAADFNLVKNPLPEEGVNLMDAPSRMEAMFANPLSKQKKKVVKKKKAKASSKTKTAATKVKKKVPAKTKAAKKTVKKTTGKAPAAKRTTTTKKVPKKKSSSTKK